MIFSLKIHLDSNQIYLLLILYLIILQTSFIKLIKKLTFGIFLDNKKAFGTVNYYSI